MVKAVCVLMFAVVSVFCQQISDSGCVYNAGGYDSFTSFLSNSPTVKDSTFVLQPQSSKSSAEKGGLILLASKRGKMRTYGENLWGFCDGQSAYIAVSGGVLTTKTYCKITVMPFFSYYSEQFAVPSAVSGGSISDPDVIQVNFTALDMKNGRKIPLTKPALREILRSHDTPLYQEFLADNRSSDKLPEYLTMLNRRLSEKK